MFKEIQELFLANEPEMVLISYNNKHQAIFQLLDCDGYRLGKLIFTDVLVLTITTGEQYYKKFEVFSSKSLPSDKENIFQEISEDYYIVLFTPLIDEESTSLGLPKINNENKGYMVCKSINFEKEINLGRGSENS